MCCAKQQARAQQRQQALQPSRKKELQLFMEPVVVRFKVFCLFFQQNVIKTAMWAPLYSPETQ
jgi:hypothetical protein